MRNFLLLIILFIICSCHKNDTNITGSNTTPPITLNDTAFQITTITKSDANEFDLSFLVTPINGESYSDLYLFWSTSPDFSSNKDSALLSSSVTQSLSGKQVLTGLKLGSSYYARLAVHYRNKIYTSTIKEWHIDSLKITMVFHTGLFPVIADRGTNVHIRTNSGADTSKTYSVGAKIFIGPYPCPVTQDKGAVFYFDIPKTIPPGQYSLKLERKGITAQTPDSVFIYIGYWNALSTPKIDVNGNHDLINSVIDYGTCYSATNGYIIGGTNIHPAGYTSFDNERSKSLYDFNALTNTWTTKAIKNPHGFENPNTFYYNNGVYVIGGIEDPYNLMLGIRKTVRYVWRLDLSTLTWSIIDNVPYSTRYLPISFEINGEWYIGSGKDSANVYPNNGESILDKDFWKYNPTLRTWTQIADYPGSFQKYPTTFTIGSKAYVFVGGTDELHHELWEYDPSPNTWKRIQIPGEDILLRGEKYSVVVYNGNAYFLTAQIRTLYFYYYGFQMQAPFIEFNPATGQVKKMNDNFNLGIVKPIYQNGNRVVFQTNVFGYIEDMPKNKTTELILE